MEFAVAQSFSKNFGLYGERVGALHVATRTRRGAARVEAGLKRISRAEITSCPGFGAKIVATVLKDAGLREQWLRDLQTMSGRLREMRGRLCEELKRRETPGGWGHVLSDVRAFSRILTLHPFSLSLSLYGVLIVSVADESFVCTRLACSPLRGSRRSRSRRLKRGSMSTCCRTGGSRLRAVSGCYGWSR